MTSTVDYSYTYVGAPTIAGAGFVGAERYLGTDGRCLTYSERDELLAEGVGIGLIFESAADRSLDGYNAGFGDAEWANAVADAAGAPHWLPIRYATDFHASQAQIDGPIMDYYRGARDFHGRPVTVYGGAPVIDRMWDFLNLGMGWQAAAASWSNYELSPHACLLQEVEQIWNGAADMNVVLVEDDEIDWLWGYEGGDMPLSEDDLNKIRGIVNDVVNEKLTTMYTGQRAVQGADATDGATYELLRDPTAETPDDALVRRYIPRPEQIGLLRYVDALAEADFTGNVRIISDPDMLAEFNRLPVVGR